jgi:hypothetical protein
MSAVLAVSWSQLAHSGNGSAKIATEYLLGALRVAVIVTPGLEGVVEGIHGYLLIEPGLAALAHECGYGGRPDPAMW